MRLLDRNKIRKMNNIHVHFIKVTSSDWLLPARYTKTEHQMTGSTILRMTDHLGKTLSMYTVMHINHSTITTACTYYLFLQIWAFMYFCLYFQSRPVWLRDVWEGLQDWGWWDFNRSSNTPVSYVTDLPVGVYLLIEIIRLAMMVPLIYKTQFHL